jgi:hypothetical protein
MDPVPEVEPDVEESKVTLRFPRNVPAYLENLRALGLLEKPISALSNVDKYYKAIEVRFEELRAQIEAAGHGGKRYPAVFTRGYFQITEFGELFMKACERPKTAEP